MSRIGKKIINIPQKTEVTLSSGVLSVKGPLGTIQKTFKPEIDIKITGDSINLIPKKMSVEANSLWGTYASHITNLIEGVNKLFSKKLVIEGIGFKSEVKGKELVMSLGFSHPVMIKIPEGLTVTAEKNIVTISGIDKEQVGQFAADVRIWKKPEPYKGKGIRYENEVVKRKQGKKSA